MVMKLLLQVAIVLIALLIHTVDPILCFAATDSDIKYEFSAYARTGFLLNASGEKSGKLWNGFAFHNRLQEGSYFELTATTHLQQNTHFVLTLGNDTLPPHYSGIWPGTGFALRNLYLEMEALPDSPSLSVWFGSRMYRGHSIYLWDSWPLDQQNLLGGGIKLQTALPMEVALGVKNESSLFSSQIPTTINNQNAHHYIFIHKLHLTPHTEANWRTNVELHYLPHAQILDGLQAIETPTELAGVFGFQFHLRKSHTFTLNYGTGTVGDSITTPTTSFDPLATTRMTHLGSHALNIILDGGKEFEQMGYLYALASQIQKLRSDSTRGALTFSLRPLYYWTPRLHVGGELDLTHYFVNDNDTSNISYQQLSAIAEYAFVKNAYGSPKIRLILSEAFYARGCVIEEGKSGVRNAFRAVLGFEAWF